MLTYSSSYKKRNRSSFPRRRGSTVSRHIRMDYHLREKDTLLYLGLYQE